MTKIEQVRMPKGAATKRTKTAAAFTQEPITVHSAESELDMAHSDFVRARDRLLDAISPRSWVREAMSYVAAFMAGAGIGWAVGLVVQAVVLSVLTTSTPITVALITCVLTITLSWHLAGKLGSIVHDIVYAGKADRYIASKYTAAKNFIGAIFDRKDITLGDAHA